MKPLQPPAVTAGGQGCQARCIGGHNAEGEPQGHSAAARPQQGTASAGGAAVEEQGGDAVPQQGEGHQAQPGKNEVGVCVSLMGASLGTDLWQRKLQQSQRVA